MNDTQPAEAPTPDQIKAQVEGLVRVMQCGTTLMFLSGQAQQMLNMLTNNNYRLSLAIAHELVLINDEVIRRQITVADNQTPAAPQATPEQQQAPETAQDTVQESSTAGEAPTDSASVDAAAGSDAQS